ncbi:MAG: hypothetical protein HY769_06830 [Candidatus Stahlbacteria bacterium]|nr:hypothetical protein [Candidatus Stahlbacteria bacterium]
MNLFILLSIFNRLDVGLSSAYITKIQYITDYPVSAFFMKPIVEYGSTWGGLMEDFYVSIDCNDTVRNLYVEMGGNCLRVGPFYRQKIKWIELTGTAGFLRIDIAGLATGKAMGVSYNDQIDEERNGGFVGLKLRYEPINMLRLTPFLCYGMVKNGKFLEYGIELSFMPFINRETSDLLKKLGFSTGISGAQLGAKMEEEDVPFNLAFGYYLIGLTYQMELPTLPGDRQTQKRKPSYKSKKSK